MNDFKKYIYLNNLSDIITISKDEKFDTLLNKLDDVKVKVSSHLIHDKNNISSYEQFFFNLDNYITFLKNLNIIKPPFWINLGTLPKFI